MMTNTTLPAALSPAEAVEIAVELYKVLGPNRKAHHGGSGEWLPAGEWMPAIKGEIEPCQRGYHLCRRDDLIRWLGPTIWVAEHDGELIEYADKVVVCKARLIRQLDTWNDRTARLFACDVAEHVLHLHETKYPNDLRVRNCIEIARKVANGDLPISKLDAAVGAAWTAVRAAAWDAAWAAAGAAAGVAAGAATWTAAGAAAADAAWDATWDAERNWQSARLWQYLDGEI